jgi:serine O-acetyltransferase
MWRLLRADVARYSGRRLRSLRLALASPGFWAVATYRLGHSVYELPKPWGMPARILYKPLGLLVQLATGIEIPPETRIGPGLYIGHWGGIVLSGRASLGASCNLSPGVTLGAHRSGGQLGAPTLGDRVYVGPGAKLFGPIAVGSDVAVGANAVVNRDVPRGVTVAGVPAQIVSARGSRDLIALHGRASPPRPAEPSSPEPQRAWPRQGGQPGRAGREQGA